MSVHARPVGHAPLGAHGGTRAGRSLADLRSRVPLAAAPLDQPLSLGLGNLHA
jgi:hypothetical protein